MEVNEDRKSEMNFELEILGSKKVVATANKKEEHRKKTSAPEINPR